MKHSVLILGICFLSLAAVSCEGKKKSPPPPPQVVVHAPDYEPLGEGMKVQSYALIAVALIIAVAVMSKPRTP